MIKVSDYIFSFLKMQGAKDVFMLPGGGAMHLVDSLGKSGLHYVCMLHEQAAAIAAEAYGQHTNRPGICCVTSGPGATNTLTGVVAGWIDSTPMFIMSGQAKRSDLVGDKGVRQIGSQEVQIVDMVRPITKYAVQILDETEIRYHLERAWYEANSGRPGPVWLDIPLDVQGALVDEQQLKGFTPPEQSYNIAPAIRETISLLKKAKCPLVLVGNGVKSAEGEDLLDRFIHELGIPVQTTWKTLDMFDESDACYVGHPGTMGDRGANFILQKADFLLSVGSRLDTSLTAFNDKDFARNAKKVIVDIDANELRRMDVPNSVRVACDAKVFLNELLEGLQGNDFPNWNDWLEECKAIRKQYPVITEEHRKLTSYISCYYFIGLLCAKLTNRDVVVPESSGAAAEITCQAFQVKKGQKVKHAAGLGSMGFGLPYAIGACIANDRRRTILIDGDGAFQMNIQELETLRRLNLPIKIFIWDNDGYVSIRNMQKNTFNSHFVACGPDSGLTLPDCCRVASAYGIPSYRFFNNQEITDNIDMILNSDGPVLCNLKVNPTDVVSPRVKAKVMDDGSMKSMPLDQMWPYLEA